MTQADTSADPAPITVTYTVSRDAYMTACHQLWAHRAVGRGGNTVVAGIVAACAGLLLWLGVPGVLPWLLLAGAAIFISLDRLRDRIWRNHYDGLVKYTGPITAGFSETGVSVASAEADRHMRWSTFKHYVITRDYLILLIDQRQFSVIPLSAFKTPDARLGAERLIAAKLKALPARLL